MAEDDRRVSDMGMFLNPDNGAFRMAVDAEIYVDKTGLIEQMNRVICTNRAFICNSRPRRFGKSVTADMLTAYYSKGCDSEKMFEEFEIAGKESFRRHLNKYDVIHFDVQWCMGEAGSAEETVTYINRNVIKELTEVYHDIDISECKTLAGALAVINTATKRRFVIIIDEWDVLIRDEANNRAVQEEYINFLRGLFKGTEPMKYIALAYLTGILPIKKLKTQSALNNFIQYTMLYPGALAQYVGFTEEEVRGLCKIYGRDFGETKRWYDGYRLGGYHVYNPNAVVNLMIDGTYQSYWSQTGTYDSIVPLINMDLYGLKASIITMMSGASVSVKTKSFQNDMVTFRNRDDVMTLLIHMGYLSYDQDAQTAYIPNEEIRSEFADAVEENEWNEMAEFERASDALLEAVFDEDTEAVAKHMEKIHDEYASAISYNNENSLSSVLTIAFLGSMKYYFKPIREMPAGRGFADFVYIPKPYCTNDYPALVVELKWNKNVHTALDQIKEKKYSEALKGHEGNVLLVGISYDKKTKEHSCVIERLQEDRALQ